MRQLVVLAALGMASCGPPTVEGKIGATQIACLEKAQQFFPKLTVLNDAPPSDGIGAGGNNVEPKPDWGQFRMVSTGKFIWDWALPAPATGKLTCTGDFNTHSIETLNYDGLDKRPAANEVWEIPSLQLLSVQEVAVEVRNSGESK